MPSDYYFGYYFYAPNGRFEPCGMFTLQHIIAAFICIAVIIASFVIFKEKLKGSAKTKVIRATAIILTILESIKIAHSFIYSNLNLDAWFPLSYCGLFIFASWMSGFGKSHLKRAGETFIAYGCPIAGIAFLIFPTTSLMSYPIWHYFSMYSLLFHSAMIFTGIIFQKEEPMLTKYSYICYAGYVLVFCIIAISLNCIFCSNLMNLREPYNIPISFLQNLYSTFNFGYTILVVVAYLAMPLLMGIICGKIKRK